MNLREARVLNAVQVLGSPRTLEVAERCGFTSADTRHILHGLEAEGLLRSEGRRWIVPSKALEPLLSAPGEAEVREPGLGCGCIVFGILFAAAFGLAVLVYLIKGVM